MKVEKLTPPQAFLHSPAGDYPEDGRLIARQRVFQPRRDADRHALVFPLDWEAHDRIADRNWRMQLQGFTMLQPLLNVFDQLEDKGEVLDYFFDVLSDWWARYRDDPVDIVTSRMPDSYAWYDMSVGFRSLILAYFAERIAWHEIELDPKRRELLTSAIAKHREHLRRPDVFYPNNHGIFQIHGLMGLSRASVDSISKSEDIRYAAETMATLLESQFDLNGVHREHSPHYHIFALRTFDLVVLSEWYDISPELRQRLEKAHSVTKWLVDPEKRPACIGDSIPTKQDLDFPTRGDGSLEVSRFHDSGYAIVRSPWNTPTSIATYLFLTAAYHSKTHKHRDCLSFEWYDRGRKRISDSGKYGYNNDKFRTYVLSNRAHNTVEIDGFDMLKMSPYGSAIKTVEKLRGGVTHIQAELQFTAFTHKRDLYLSPGQWLLVDDHLSFRRRRASTQWNHLALGSTLTSVSSGRMVFKTADHLDLVVTNLTGAKAEVLWGDTEKLQGFVSEGDNQIEPAYAVGFRAESKETRITTALSLGQENEYPALAFASSLRVQVPSQSSTTPLRIIPDAQHIVGVGEESASFNPEPASYTIHTSAGELHAMSHPGRSDYLLVDLGDGKSAEHFQDKAIVASGFAYLSIADPTLNSGNLAVGWFQGNGRPVIPSIARVAQTMARSLSPETRIIVTGRGVGGFGAVKVGALLRCEYLARKPLDTTDLGTDARYAMLRHSYSSWRPSHVDVVFENYLSSPESHQSDSDWISDPLKGLRSAIQATDS